MGLAWTALGGSTLYVEAASVEKGEGKGSLKATGGLAGWHVTLSCAGCSSCCACFDMGGRRGRQGSWRARC